jgi:hypothetical protein
MCRSSARGRNGTRRGGSLLTITAVEVLAALRRIEARGRHEGTARGEEGAHESVTVTSLAVRGISQLSPRAIQSAASYRSRIRVLAGQCRARRGTGAAVVACWNRRSSRYGYFRCATGPRSPSGACAAGAFHKTAQYGVPNCLRAMGDVPPIRTFRELGSCSASAMSGITLAWSGREIQ